MTIEEFKAMTPDSLFIYLTGNVLYEAVRLGNEQKINEILSCFDPDARRCLCVGLSALRAIGDTHYRTALMSAMSETLYEYYNKEETP